MPIKIPDNLPTAKILQKENIFVMSEDRAYHQDIRPLKIVLLNLMPTKIVTETQILRLLGNSPLQVEITLLHPQTHHSQNTPQEYLVKFYRTFQEIKREKFDGMIITGAPVEQLAYEEVDFWEEMKRIMEWSKSNVFSTMHICWGAMAGLYYHYGIPKYQLKEKSFGVFPHHVNREYVKLLRGFDDEFYVPHSRHTEIRHEDVEKVPELEILAESAEAGVYLVASCDGRQIFVTGHLEYDPLTLKEEYERDLQKELPIKLPVNYFPDDDHLHKPLVRWRSHANLLYMNWLNYYVYQETPYNYVSI